MATLNPLFRICDSDWKFFFCVNCQAFNEISVFKLSYCVSSPSCFQEKNDSFLHLFVFQGVNGYQPVMFIDPYQV